MKKSEELEKRNTVEVSKMIEREYIIKKVKSLTEDSIRKLAKYIESLEKEEKKKDPLARVIVICKGPLQGSKRPS